MVNMNKSPIEGIFFRNWKASFIPNILEEIYLKKVYQPYLLGKKDQIIVDVGANIGLFSYYAKDYAKEVFAVEPDTDHREEMGKMIEFNKITNITVCPYAISNKTEKTRFYHNNNTTMNSLNVKVSDHNDYEEVDVLSFDEFMVRNKLDHIDLLKLDPEGEEGKIVTSEGFAKYASKIKVIVGEWHAWSEMDQNQFANVLKDLGFKFFWHPNTDAKVYTAVYMPSEKKEPSVFEAPIL